MTTEQAFPNYEYDVNDRGMTLRDYFAAKAMSYWLCLPMLKEDLDKVSVEAYKVADAMMKAREL